MWLEWLSINGTLDIVIPPASPLAQPQEVQTSCPVEIAREVERLALSTLRECGRQKALATKAGKPEMIIGWTTAEIQAQKMYALAHSAREKEEQKAGRTITVAQVEKERIEFTAAIREVFRAQPAEVGPQANPTNPQLAIRALARWYAEKLAPALAALSNGPENAAVLREGGRGEEGDGSPSLAL